MYHHPSSLTVYKELSAMSIYSLKSLPSGFYVYAYLRNDGTPYYIGKGQGKRAWARSDRTVFPLKDFSNIIILIDIINGIEIPFDCHNSLEILKPLGIDPKSLFWAKRYNKNGIYKNRYTVR